MTAKTQKQVSRYTATPWVFLPNGVIGHSNAKIIKNEDEFDWVATLQVSNVPEWKENGEFIVKACNNFEKLKTALDQAYSVINQLGHLSQDKLYQHELENIKQLLKEVE